jgi:hypothetical protein
MPQLFVRLRGGSRKVPLFENLPEGLWLASIIKNGKLGGIGKTKKEAASCLQEELDAMYDRLKSITQKTPETETTPDRSVITLADFIQSGLGCNMQEAREEANHCIGFFAALIREGNKHGTAEEANC